MARKQAKATRARMKRTLRDDLAMAALTGYAANARVMNNAIDGWKESGGERPTCIAEYLAGLSYEVADEMMKARELHRAKSRKAVRRGK